MACALSWNRGFAAEMGIFGDCRPLISISLYADIHLSSSLMSTGFQIWLNYSMEFSTNLVPNSFAGWLTGCWLADCLAGCNLICARTFIRICWCFSSPVHSSSHLLFSRSPQKRATCFARSMSYIFAFFFTVWRCSRAFLESLCRWLYF